MREGTGKLGALVPRLGSATDCSKMCTFNYQSHHDCRLPIVFIPGFMKRAYEIHSVGSQWHFRRQAALRPFQAAPNRKAPCRFIVHAWALYHNFEAYIYMYTILGCSGDLVSRLSNGPYWASYGLLLGLIGDTK